MNENQFREKLSQLTQLAKEQKMCVSEQQIDELFSELLKNEEQKSHLYEYLKSQRITVGDEADLDEFLSMEEKDYLEEYMESIALIEVLDRELLEQVMMSAVAGDGEAQQIVLSQFLSQVPELAKLYAGQGVFLEDLIGEGNLALAQAVLVLPELEITDGMFEEVSGFIGNYMMKAMEQMINDEADEKNADREMVEKVNRVADVAEELSQELQRKVSPEEICAHSELTLEEVASAMKVSANLIDTIEMEFTNDSDE